MQLNNVLHNHYSTESRASQSLKGLEEANVANSDMKVFQLQALLHAEERGARMQVK